MRQQSRNDQRETRRYTLLIALIALAAVLLLAALITPSAIPLAVLWPPVIALLTEAVRGYLGPWR